MYNELNDELLAQLFDFLHQPKYLNEVEDLYRSFLEKIESPEEMPQYLYQWFAEGVIFDYDFFKGKNLVEVYLAEEGAELTRLEKEILISWRELPLSIYEVQEYKYADDLFCFFDLIRNEKMMAAKEDYNIIEGEIVIARMVRFKGEGQIIGSFDVLPAVCKSAVDDKVEEILTDYFEGEAWNMNRFLQKRSIDLICLWESLQKVLLNSFPAQLEKAGEIYEASYALQSQKLARKKLTSHPEIKLYQSNPKLEVLLWYEEDEPVIKGEFFLAPDQLWFRTYLADDLVEGKKLVKELLSFVVQFDEEYIIDNQPKRVTESELKGGEMFEGVPRGLAESLNLGKELGEDSLKKVELDEIEKIMVSKMEDEFSLEVIHEAVDLWRDYKEKTGEKTDNESKNWAAALEYLICKLNYWNDSPQKIADKYEVSTEAVTRKCRKISEALRL